MSYYILDERGVLVSGPHEPQHKGAPLPQNAFATNDEPPSAPPGKVVRKAGAGWVVTDEPPLPAPVYPELPPVGPDRLHRGSFATDLLTAAENDAWIDLVDEAEQTAPASRTQTQKDQLRAWRHFTLHEYIDRENDFTQAACMALYVWGVLGPVYDDQSGEPPTEAELAAIARADRIARFLPPES